MVHPLVRQLRFTRAEFRRGLRTVDSDAAQQRVAPLNSLAWSIGHLAWQEQKYFLHHGQGVMPYPAIDRAFRSGAPASTPPLDEMWQAWTAITSQADPWLDTLTSDRLARPYTRRDGRPGGRILGSLLQRVVYHYWYHLGENMAIRKLLGHAPVPQFVGNLDERAPYLPEAT
jgi:uncharacterized damage-inducible protein DinB